MNRRRFFAMVAAAAPALRAGAPGLGGLKIGVTDWNLRLTGKVEAVALAHRLGFDGVEVSIGRKPVDGRLPLDHDDIQDRYLAAAKEFRIGIAGTCLDILHVNGLKDDKLAQKWVRDGIPITRRLNARVMLLPFFGKRAMTTQQELDHVADVLKELAPAAEKAGVTLGLENTNSARENARILDRVRSNAVKVYYDVGNSMSGGYNVVEEIRWLGSHRICQMHLKDNPHYLGEGKIDFPAVIAAISDIGFSGFANLETDCPSNSVEQDMARNLAYVRKLITARRAGRHQVSRPESS